MNKKEFLDELGSCLLILQDGEQSDILEEYSQHIDMKVESGLSEEEAIHDFGSVKELAAEILEAYHVKPEFPKDGQKTAKDKVGVNPSKSQLTKFRRKATKAICAASHRCWNAIKRFCAWLSGILLLPFQAIHSMSSKGPQEGTEPDGLHSRLARPRRSSRESGYAVHKESALQSIGHTTGKAVAGSLSWASQLFFWCIRWCWNIAMISIAFIGALFTMGALFGFATLIVWLAQGYPLVGVTVACFGLLLCCSAFTIFCAGSIRRRHEGAAASGPRSGSMEKEVQDA